MSEIVSESYGFIRLPMSLVWIFAAFALLLATVGIFGVMSYAVSRRTQEMAIRMALGASRTDVLRLVLREGLIVTMFGVVLGLVTALAVSPRDGWLCIRHQGDGPDHLCGSGAAADRGLTLGRLSPRVVGDAGRPDHGVEV